MKRLLAALAVVFCLLPSGVFAQAAWRIDKFRSDVAVLADGVVDVRETVVAEFLTDRHGIYRYVPVEGKDDQGHAYRLDVRLAGVTRDGEPERVETSRQGGNVVWKIGRADLTMRGTHTYVIEYEVRGAIGRFEDFDEIYWNVTGEGWDVPLPVVSAVVTLPEGVSVSRSACYTGTYGSTAQDCTIVDGASEAGFVSTKEGLPMTVAVGFPKGAVAGPSAVSAIAAWLARWGGWFFPLIVLAYMYRRWRREGDDAPFGSVVAQYDAPDGLTPAETIALIRQNSTTGSLAPTIVDLASRGYLRIEESEKKGLLRTKKDYALVRLKGQDATLRPFERRLMNDLFAAASDRVELSSLKDKFYTNVPPFISGVMASLTERGHFDANPEKVRGRWIVIGLLVGFAAWILGKLAGGVTGESYLFPSLACGFIVLAFSPFMPKWSDKGAAAAAHARGFQEFVSKVEKYRAPWMEDQNIFFKVLPFALAFGLGKKWAEAFSGLQMQPPSWYVGAQAGAFNAVAFNDSLTSWSGSFISAASSSPSSSSGSGGGGFSGGGGGGGGGGSW